MNSMHARLKQITRIAAMGGGFGILFIALMVTTDVFLRGFLGKTVGGAGEIAGFVFAVATVISYPFVLLDRANVRIDVIYTHLSVKVRAILDLVAMLLLLYVMAVLSTSGFGLLMKSWTMGSRSVGVLLLPLWIPQSLWVLGFVLTALTALFLAFLIGIHLVRRNWAGASRIAGIPSIAETIEEETHLDASDRAAAPSSASEKETL